MVYEKSLSYLLWRGHRESASVGITTFEINIAKLRMILIVMGKMKISSESNPASSEVFWNRFREVGPESVSRIHYGIGSGVGSGIGSRNPTVVRSKAKIVLLKWTE